MERHEHLAPCHALGNPARAHHGVAARGQSHEVAVLEPELARVVGVDLDGRRGLPLVEPRRAPGHGARVPVIQLPPRVHHERIRLVGELDGRRVLDGNERALPICGREPVVEEKRGSAGVVRRHRVLQSRPFEPLVGHAPPRWSHPRDFSHHRFSRLEASREPQAVRQVDQDLEVAPRLPRGGRRLAGELNATLGVHERAGLFGETRAGQDHVGVAGGLRQEQVVHREELELLEPVLGVCDVGV